MHLYNNIYENTSFSVQHKYKVTVHINNSEGDKIVLKKWTNE
jgi:hypothetical protein